jgi:hypothetical protein
MQHSTLECLEARSLCSVSLDANGWTNVGPSSDTQVIYVSNSAGNDSNTGLSSSAPVQTLAKGIALLRTGKPDWLLLNRGDTWNAGLGSWSKSGRSTSEPMLISSYGTGPRPVLKTGGGNGLDEANAATVNYLDIIGLEFYASSRDPNSVDFSGSPVADTTGIRWLGPSNGFLIEDSVFRFFATNLILQTYAGVVQNVTIRRSAIVDAYSSSGAHSQGIYAQGVIGLLIEENVVDHNGWNTSVIGAQQTKFNHNVYINTTNTNVVFRNNISANASSHGIQLRPGGIATGNLFVRDPLGLLVGGAASTISGNVFLEGNDIDAANPRGFGIDVNPSTGPIDVSDNVIAHDASAAAFGHAVGLASGTTGVSVANNIIYSWRGGILNYGSGNTISGNVINGTGYPDPTRSMASYNQLLGGTATLGAFLQEARLQSKTNWRPSYTAQAAVNYVRAGFGLAAIVGNNLTPTANVTASNMVAGGQTTYTFTVNYSDDTGIDVSTLGSTDISVTGPNAFSQSATFVSVDVNSNGTPRTATYRINAPGGTWDIADAGTYTISMASGQVLDIAGSAVSAGTLGTFLVTGADTTAPTALVSAATISTSGGTTQTLTVTYSDNIAVNVAGLDSSDIQVTGPNGYSQIATFVSVNTNSNGTPRTATYSIPAAGGSWDLADNGTYTVAMRASQVADTSGNFVATGTLGTFSVAIAVGDTTPPTATGSANNITTAGATTGTISVTYTDNVAIKVSATLDISLRVTGPNNFSAFTTFASIDINSDGTPRTLTYTFPAPGGSWDATDNGTYSIVMDALQASDTAGNFVPAGTLGTFSVNIGGADSTAPTATATATAITTGGATTQTFTVTYSDNVAINVAGLDSSDIQVTGPSAFSQIATFVSVNTNSNGTPRTATYSINAPGGTWDLADNGTYTLAMRASQVADTSGNSVAAATLGTFSVNIADVTAPTATLSASNVTTAGATTQTFTVTYSDNVAINVAGLDSSDILVTGPNAFSQTATFVSVDVNSNGTPRIATYQINTPGGTWDLTDNGTYTIAVKASQVADTSNNFVAAATLGTFTVNIGDTTAPTATVTASNVTTGGGTSKTFTVTYSDNVAINVAGLDSSDIQVTGPSGFSQVATFVSVNTNSNGTPRTTTYSMNAPGGSWDLGDNGTYTLAMRTNQMADTAGNFVAAGTLGTFTVTIPDTTAPTATLSASNVTTAGGTTKTFTVTYSDNVAINIAGLDSSDVQVTGPNAFSQIATFVSVDVNSNGTPRIATYSVTAPGGTWDLGDNGTYTVTMRTSQVADTAGNFVAAVAVGTFATNIADTTVPTATVSASNITTAGGTTKTFTVTYSDNVAINVAGLDSSDVQVTGPNSFSQIATFVSVNTNSNGTPRTATYSITTPGGSWDLGDNGTYTIAMRTSQVADTGGNFVAAGTLGTFTVNIADSTAPTATLSTSNVTTVGGTTKTFTVTYSDNVAINVAGLDSSDIQVTGPSAFSQLATFVSVDVNGNGTPRVATYSITAPGGSWDVADNGTYTIAMRTSQVADTSANFVVAATLGTFATNIGDATAPTATASASNVTVSGAASSTFTVTYSDNVAVNVATLDSSDIQITGPNGFSQTATFVSVNTNTNGTPRTATYSIGAPGGSWDSSDTGTYTIAMRTSQVADTSGNFVAAATLGTFNVNIADTTAPTATLSAPNVTTVGGTTQTFTVTYSDNVAINVAGLDSSDIQVTGPNAFSQLATFVSVNVNSNGTPRVATYSIAAPGIGWDITDNGSYSIALGVNQVADTSGNFAAAATLGAFSVNINGADTTAPTATLSASNVTTAGGATKSFTVTYNDDVAVDVTGLDSSDILVTGPSGFSQIASFVSVDVNSNGTPRAATYSISAPGGAWDLSDNGTYTVSARSNQVDDASGNFVAAGALGSFAVNIADTTAPTATLTTSNISGSGAATVSFSVTFADNVAINVATLDSADIQVTGPNGFTQVATFVSVNSNTNGAPRAATYRIAGPGGTWDAGDSGSYTVTMLASQVADTNGNSVAGGALGTLAVNISDSNAPTASLSAANVTTAGGAGTSFTVTYTDDVAVNVTMLDSLDIQVNGPKGYSQLATLVSVDVNSNGTPRVATYSISAAGGSWDLGDNGLYTVLLTANQVADTSSNFAASGSLGTFAVNIADTTAPTATLSVAAITDAGGSASTFTVTYSDDVAVSVASLDSSDIRVSGLNGFSQLATLVSVDLNSNGTPRVATYSIAAPGGTWDLGDNGAYTIAMQAGQAADTGGNFVAAGTLGTLAVNIADTAAPTATASTAIITTGGGTTQTFAVTFNDDVAVNVATLDSQDIRVIGPHGYSQLATLIGVDVNTNGSPRVATYSVSAAGGAWDFTDNGAYTISLHAGEVSDTSGNAAAAGPIGIFNVSIADVAAPTATLAASDISGAGGTASTFTVTYSDDVAINVSTLDSADIGVTGPNGFSQIASLVTVDVNSDGTPRMATYSINAPGGSWGIGDNGAYTISVRSAEVSDMGGNFVAAGALGGFNVNVPDTTAPTATLAAANITVAGSSTATFTVSFTDDVAVDVTTLGSSNLQVSGPNGFSQVATFVGVNINSNGAVRTATYSLAAPRGSWGFADNGTYTVTILPIEISDTSDNFVVAGTLGTFNVNVPDTIAPGAALSASSISIGGGSSTVFTVTYTDDTAINVGTLDSNDIQVTGPNGYSQTATFLGVDVNSNGSPRVATYSVTAPGGTWNGSDNGAYTVLVQAGEVADMGGNPAGAGSIGGFQVSIFDPSIPTATANLASLTLSANGTATFTVIYADDVAIKVNSIGSDDLQISGPNGYSQTATLVSVNNNSNGSPRQATYRITAPSGHWSAADDGAYTIAMMGGSVGDTQANFVAAGTLGVFSLNIPDTSAPTASLTVTNITSAGGATATFTVTYADNVALNVGTLDSADILVSGPNGFSQIATFVGVDVNSNGTPRVATYRINAPGGTWDAVDNGAYSMSVRPSQVADTTGNMVSTATMGAMQVNITDSTAPTATLSVSDITSNSATKTFTVTYTDDVAMKVASLDSSDIQVSGPNGFAQMATLVSVNVNSNGTPRTATYRLSGPGGTWDTTDSGVYTVSMLSSQAADTSGNYVAAGTLGTFNVNIVDSTAPTAALSVSSVTSRGVASTTFTVTYNDDVAIDVATLDSSDLLVTGPNGFLQLATFVSASSNSNGTPRVGTYRINAPGGTWDSADNGVYSVAMGASQVADTADNVVVVGTLGSFQVNVPLPGIPTATANVSSLQLFADGTATFSVIYSDDTAINVSSIGAGDLLITGPRQYSQAATFVSINNNSNGTPRQAIYRFPAPGGNWNAADNGAYTINVQPNEVSDTQGNSVPVGSLGTLSVNIPDTTAPTAALASSDVSTTDPSAYTFTVRYTDDAAIALATIGTDDLLVTGPSGFSQLATLIGTDSASDGPTITATYQIAPPTDSDLEVGVYTVSVRAQQVTDTGGNLVKPVSLSSVLISLPPLHAKPDTTAPTATLAASDLLAANQAAETFTVTYFDDIAVNSSSIGSSDLKVDGPNAFSHTATLVSTANNINGSVTATYLVNASSATWLWDNNGIYTVSMLAGEVTDTSANAVAAGALGTFKVDVPDTQAPTAALTATDITAGLTPTYVFEVTYADGSGVVAADLDNQDIQVTGPNGYSELATLISVDVQGTAVTATYSITAPGGLWDAADNGDYTIGLRGDQVFDSVGNPMPAGTLGTLQVDVTNHDTGGNSRAKAKAIKGLGIGQQITLSDFLSATDHHDYYKWTVTATTKVKAILAGSPVGIAHVVLQSSDGHTVALTKKTTAKGETLSGQLAAGTYYFHVYSTSTEDVSYSLKIASAPVATTARVQTASLTASKKSRDSRGLFSEQLIGAADDEFVLN